MSSHTCRCASGAEQSRPSATPCARARRRRCPSTTRMNTPTTARHNAWSQASTYRRRCGTVSTQGVVDNTEGESGPDPWVEEAPVLAGIAAASVQGRVALGPRAGAQVRRCGASAELAALSPSALGPCHAHRNGFDLHAAVVVPANDRARLERTCRYALRPPVAHDRIHLTNTGQVLLELRHRWSDGTTHVLFDPIEFLERLAALTPPAANQPDPVLRGAGCPRRLAHTH